MVIAGAVSLIAVAVTVASLVWLHVRRPASPRFATPSASTASPRFAPVTGLPDRVRYRWRGARDRHRRAIKGHGHVGVVALLVLFGAARGAISWFPTDAPARRARRPA